MEDVVPFCPLCQTSLTEPWVVTYALACNHLVCQRCLWKQCVDDCSLRCYLDASITRFEHVRELRGFANDLAEAYLEVVQLTMGSQAMRLDEALRTRFSVNYERGKITCRRVNCPDVKNGKCKYDHSGQFYKKTWCGYNDTCPNKSTCIFLHTGEETQSTGLATSPIPRPSQTTDFNTLPTSSINSILDSRFQTIPDARVNYYYPGSEATLPEYWQCPNCKSGNHRSHTGCSQCSFIFH